MYIKLLVAVFLVLAIGGGSVYIKNREATTTTSTQDSAQNASIIDAKVAVTTSLKLDMASTTKQTIMSNVYINGRELTEGQMKEIARLYGKAPIAGKYWYDSRSGLFGVIGGPSVGSIAAGQSFGALSANASNGNTCVYVNGRILAQNELIFLSQLVGSEIQCGKYWLDANGNAGIEGLDTPLVNLYVAAKSQGGTGGGNGDKFWSTGYSAGNSNSDNSQGYVSVPGYGPVGYGF